MKKELTVNEIVAINATLNKVAKSNKVSGKAAYSVYRNLSKTSKVADDYEKTRTDLISQYGEEDPEVEGQVIVKRGTDNYKKFVEELTEVLSGTEEIDLYMIQEDDLDKFADADLDVSDFAVIDVFLVEHPEEEEEEDDDEAPEGDDTSASE